MKRVQIIHWKEDEVRQYTDLLASTGHNICCEVPRDSGFFKKVRKNPPDVFVVDLSRLAAQGRDVALALRKYKATRHIPLVLVGGRPAKVAAVRSILPDALYTSWEKLPDALKNALAHPPENPIVPKSMFDGYAGTPLTKKLGIKPNSVVGLIGAPRGFHENLEDLPAGVLFSERAQADCERVFWFVRTRTDLESGLAKLTSRNDFKALWILWPKKASGVLSDLSQQMVREAGMDAGLVDYKVCSINATWSGLLFARRK
jgi:hypothetical protein